MTISYSTGVEFLKDDDGNVAELTVSRTGVEGNISKTRSIRIDIEEEDRKAVSGYSKAEINALCEDGWDDDIAAAIAAQKAEENLTLDSTTYDSLS